MIFYEQFLFFLKIKKKKRKRSIATLKFSISDIILDDAKRHFKHMWNFMGAAISSLCSSNGRRLHAQLAASAPLVLIQQEAY